MKSMTKLMVVAMILAAALVVAPAAAARNVTDGTTIYVGEENLNLTGVFNPGAGVTSGVLVYAPGESNQKIMSVYSIIDYDLLEADVGSTTGLWYAYNSSSDVAKDGAGAAGTVQIQNPSKNLRVLLGSSGTTSVDGQRVTGTQSIRFRIDSNLGDLAVGAPAGYANMTVRVTTPGGGTVEVIDGVPLSVNVTTRPSETAAIPMANLTFGTYTARAVWGSGTADLGDTNAVTFEVVSGSVAITAKQDTVVRNNAIAVDITGESEMYYWVNVTTTGNIAPALRPSQTGVQPLSPDEFHAFVKTTAAGTRTLEFTTNASTEAKTYTFEVSGPFNAAGAAIGQTQDDSVKVRVEKGAVTITTSGTGVYYIGEEVTLSGTNTDNKKVYLFMTGPNLPGNGVNLEDVTKPVATGVKTNFTEVDVKADDTWSWKWDTSKAKVDAGSYTIYAVSDVKAKDKISEAKYATASVSLRSGFITATTSGATVAKGNDLTLSGTAQGNPGNVFVWIFGKNYYGANDGQLNVLSPSVESDGTFEEEISTDQLAAGQYFVIVQHPMGVTTVGNAGSLTWTPAGSVSAPSMNPVTITNLQAPAAASALIDILDSPNIPDTYVKLTFVIEEPQLFIDAIGDKAAGSKFTITGTTNLAVGDTLNIEVTSAAFQPGQKTEASAFSGVGGTAVIQQGDGANTWSFEVDGASFKPDQYIVKVESIETDTTATAAFNVVEAVPTTQATPTATATGEVTPTATTTTEATPTQSPGFGALLALAGLGAVAFLVLRRD
ncbi:DUF3821 domain-containing protein [Methanoculleus sp. Afa-1]|uniref:DUF3821 domain-containing protein n=1 Tax=Methanoculleus formosensis TaxID=2590886 RepID=A0A9E4ZIF5_9EURY|nr:MEMAR_RS02690 family S-layer glycoprotein [Methanoculleus sp. Afa-1]MCT8336437.1 DUF3821 domain-containing protein [Methanoculleus sp. Afa-1]